MRLTDKDAAFIALCINGETLKEVAELEPVEKKNGVWRYETDAGSFFLPETGYIRPNKALDALDKIAKHLKLSVLETAHSLILEGRLVDEW